MTTSQAQKPTWDRYAIAADIKRRGSTLVEVALNAGLERSACSVALLRPHPAGERAISDFLGVSLSVLWPARYPAASNASHAEDRANRPSPASPIGGSA